MLSRVLSNFTSFHIKNTFLELSATLVMKPTYILKICIKTLIKDKVEYGSDFSKYFKACKHD